MCPSLVFGVFQVVFSKPFVVILNQQIGNVDAFGDIRDAGLVGLCLPLPSVKLGFRLLSVGKILERLLAALNDIIEQRRVILLKSSILGAELNSIQHLST